MAISPRYAVATVVLISSALTLASVPPSTWWTTATASLAAGASALALMATAALLGSRWRLLEAVFGGLDRVYQAHKWLAVWALALAAFHFVFKAELPGWETSATLGMSRPTARLVRQLSLVALGLIVILALNRNIPYGRWRWLHKLSGPLFLIVVLHWLTIPSPLTLTSAAGIWLAILSTLGVMGAAYKLLLYPALAPHARYRIAAVEHSNDAVGLQLVPAGHGVDFTPGQFAFLRIDADGLREPHPFTAITGGGEQVPIRFAIRALGDYTRQLAQTATPGMEADVYGPFGRFTQPQARRQIWIGGGVGISPFLAWLQGGARGADTDIMLIYLYNPGRAFPPTSLIAELAARQGIRFVPIASADGSSAFGQALADELAKPDAAELAICLCGPRRLLRHVQQQMAVNHLQPRQLRHEVFEFR